MTSDEQVSSLLREWKVDFQGEGVENAVWRKISYLGEEEHLLKRRSGRGAVNIAFAIVLFAGFLGIKESAGGRDAENRYLRSVTPEFMRKA